MKWLFKTQNYHRHEPSRDHLVRVRFGSTELSKSRFGFGSVRLIFQDVGSSSDRFDSNRTEPFQFSSVRFGSFSLSDSNIYCFNVSTSFVSIPINEISVVGFDKNVSGTLSFKYCCHVGKTIVKWSFLLNIPYDKSRFVRLRQRRS